MHKDHNLHLNVSFLSFQEHCGCVLSKQGPRCHHLKLFSACHLWGRSRERAGLFHERLSPGKATWCQLCQSFDTRQTLFFVFSGIWAAPMLGCFYSDSGLYLMKSSCLFQDAMAPPSLSCLLVPPTCSRGLRNPQNRFVCLWIERGSSIVQLHEQDLVGYNADLNMPVYFLLLSYVVFANCFRTVCCGMQFK